MKRNKLTLLIGIAILALSQTNCERDDICGETTPTTPRLVLEFYNNDMMTNLKPVTVDMFEIDQRDTIRVTSQSKIYVPLRSDSTISTWVFTINPDSNNEALIRTDTLTFNYQTKEIYVSRACGYKNNFDLNLDTSLAPAVIHTPSAPQAWMRSLNIVNYQLETENNAHIKVYW